MARASRAESLGKGGEVVAHIAKVEQAAVCTCLRGRIVMLIDNGIGLPPPPFSNTLSLRSVLIVLLYRLFSYVKWIMDV